MISSDFDTQNQDINNFISKDHDQDSIDFEIQKDIQQFREEENMKKSIKKLDKKEKSEECVPNSDIEIQNAS